MSENDAENDASPFHEFQYAAFISYSRRDEKFAKWLHRKLESLRFPAIRPNLINSSKWPLRPVFRDVEELSASSDLTKSICSALENSRALIVICSPHAAASHWVNQEIEQFSKLGRSDQIFLVLVNGDPAFHRDGSGIAAFPPAIEGLLTEPLWIDARTGTESRERIFARIAAGLIGVSFDAIWQRRRRQKRVALLSWGIAALMIGIPVGVALIELVKPMNLKDCPLDLVAFESTWGSERFVVDRVGSNRFYVCGKRELSLDEYSRLAENDKEPGCKGPLGSIFLKGHLQNIPQGVEADRYMIYQISDGSPCCLWNSPSEKDLVFYTEKRNINWHSENSMPKLQELKSPVIEFDRNYSDMSSDDYLPNMKFSPNFCEYDTKRKMRSILSSWFSDGQKTSQ
ncbi:toll/interleukin-1 receptor domain-containing protein [Sphingopyxis sp. J-6]|uniref:toll/interleukin-1 receptor domain-containing protein n=1 Tax=Sphingopyxis sp. J-6 TaxID=3122054 RepID=UPI0039845EC7